VTSERVDAVVVGAGHNGLVAAIALADAGLDVVVSNAPTSSGAPAGPSTRSRPPRALGVSTGAYLLGPFPPELLTRSTSTCRCCGATRTTSCRPPTRPLAAARQRRGGEPRALARFTSDADVRALEAMQADLAALRDDLAPRGSPRRSRSRRPPSAHVRPALRDRFVALVRGSVADHLGRYGFGSDLLPAMYAVTDAFPGLHGGWDTPGSGFNFLVHNLCRLPGADGTWMIVRGGMGTVTAALAERARAGRRAGSSPTPR
jgi:phytoene dehydrogenase-like protein